MPFDGLGNYSPPGPPTYPAVAGTKIRASYFNAIISDISTALSNCWARDGQSTATGAMNFLDANFNGTVAVTGNLTLNGGTPITSRWITGEYIIYVGTTAPTGTVIANGGTIGNAASSATNRANADTSALFTLLWNSSANADLPLQDSSGAPVSRGASAAIDFAANRRLPLPNFSDGESFVAAVSSGLSGKSVGAAIAHAHTFVGNAVADHAHTFLAPAIAGGSQGTGPNISLPSSVGSVTGSAGGHTPSGTITNSLGAKNLAAGVFVKILLAL